MSWTYNDPEGPATEWPLITIVAAVSSATSLVCVSLRLIVSRRTRKTKIGAEDWTAGIAWICCVGFATITCVQMRWGLDMLRRDDSPSENGRDFDLAQFVGSLFYNISIYAFRMSVLLFYRRIGGHVGNHKRALRVTILLHTFFLISILGVQIHCRRVALQWDWSLTSEGHCIDRVLFYSIAASLAIVFDLLILVLPVRVIWKLQMSKHHRCLLLGLVAINFLTTVVPTVIRLTRYLDTTSLIMLSVIENNVGVVVTCVPTLWRLIYHFHGCLWRTTRAGGITGQVEAGGQSELPCTGENGESFKLGRRAPQSPLMVHAAHRNEAVPSAAKGRESLRAIVESRHVKGCQQGNFGILSMNLRDVGSLIPVPSCPGPSQTVALTLYAVGCTRRAGRAELDELFRPDSDPAGV
ncbi:hypothetical protein S40288_07060 [Stachybotrys chartarum IBT 40288]|nr:hypothetical protein S40288_07060 [Stachybotrys chartarum IBT 40288]